MQQLNPPSKESINLQNNDNNYNINSQVTSQTIITNDNILNKTKINIITIDNVDDKHDKAENISIYAKKRRQLYTNS